MSRLKRLVRSEGGAAAVEFAIVALALVLACVGVIEFGRGLHLRNELSFAGDRAARMILTDPTASDEKLEIAVRSAFNGPDSELLLVAFGSESAGGVAFRTVQLQYPLTLLVPGLGEPITLTLSRRVPAG